MSVLSMTVFRIHCDSWI